MRAGDIKAQKQSELQRACKEQTTASNPAHSAWVEASAGTGKTKVLSDRVLRLLLDDVMPSKILCLTFTKAAAVEMKERIYGKLSKWAVMCEKDLYEELQKLYNNVHILEEKPEFEEKARKLFALVLDAPQPIKIQTIHGFCEEILKRFPLEAGVSPYFEVMEDQTTDEILEQISHQLLSANHLENDEKMKKALVFLTNNIKEMKWGDFLNELISKRNLFLKAFRAYQNVEAFEKALLQKFCLKENPTREKEIQSFYEALPRQTIKKCADALMKGSATDQDHAKFLYQALENFDYEVYKKAFLKKSDGKPYADLAHAGAINAYENILADMCFEATRLLDLEERLKSIKVFDASVAVATIALKLIEEYGRYKKERSKLDYDDLIVLTRALLEKGDACAWVLFKLDGGIEHVLIDEAQDTSENQWAIVEALTKEFFSGLGQGDKKRTIFAVGDRKQSIFKFQGAEPERFDEMREKYEHLIAPSEFKNVNLAVSFRSTSAVLDMVNRLFSIDEAKKGVVENGTEVKHLPYRLGEAGVVELWPLVEGEEKEEDVWELPVLLKDEHSHVAKLALKIARKIKKMVENGEILESQNRPLEYRDFMVLVKQRKPFMEEFVKACKKTGVAITGVDRLNLLSEIAVEDLISLARFLLLPNDDLSLAEVLKSPLYNLSDDDLFELCYQRKDKSLWQKVCENEKYVSIKDELSELLKNADYMRPFEIFDAVLNTFEGKKRFYERLGLEAKDAIDEFMNLALSFEAEHVPNLQNFVGWILGNDVEIKRELEQASTNAVRLMTVHSSKGLQAPIVILPDTMRYPATSHKRELIFDEDVFYFPLQAEDYNQNCEDVFKENAAKESDEYRRLLYVALTRAEDRLYVAGFGKKPKEKKESNWYELCEETLEQMGAQKEGGKFVLKTKQEAEIIEEEKKPQVVLKPRDDGFAFKKAPEEKGLSKPYSPSHMEDLDDAAASSPLEDEGFCYRRGTIIHKLLQMLPQYVSKDERKMFVQGYLSKQNDLSEGYKKDIENEVLKVLGDADFAFIFEGNSRAEVPLMGEVDGKIISGQVDRLIVQDDKVIVVDFKTNRPAASKREDVAQAYVKQMDVYKKLLEQVYQGKTVETYILWTNVLKLMKI
ncbi:MAG TPA: double-strand break repair helicase AddA [Alphaproteobacteria bacterium]|nr:double-strand break repair helicase AddA [Alphaproteobacteria bacterium]